MTRRRIVGILIAAVVAVAALSVAGYVQVRGATGPFPLFVQMNYQKESGLVKLEGSTLPGTVVQARAASSVVSNTGKFSLQTSLPVSLVAVRSGKIRRFSFDLPSKAKSHVSTLVVRADLSRMWATVRGNLTVTEHPPAKVIVKHGQAGTTHDAGLTKGVFSVGVPVVRGKNTLHWWLQIGPAQWQGPDIAFTAQ